MFKRDKKIQEYMNAIAKVKLPSINGEEYITKNNQKYKSKIKISSIMITAASLGVIFLVTTFGSNLLQTKDVENKKIPFAITAYAGTQEVNLQDNRKIELPSGFIEDGVFNMQGLYMEGDDISKISLKNDNGSVSIASTKNLEKSFNETMYIGENSGMSGMNTSDTDKPGITVQYKTDSEIDDIISDLQNSARNKTQNDVKEESVDTRESSKESSFMESQTSREYFEFDNTEGATKYYITWIPEKEFLKKLCTNSIDDYSKEQGCVMNITITFKDGTTLEKTLNLTFGKTGNLIVELK